MFRRWILLSPDAPPGTGTPPPEETPPPAASVVQGGALKEEDAAELVRLRQEKEELARKVKERETRVCELEDETHRLKSIHRQSEPKRTGGGRWTFFHQDSNPD